MNHKGLARAFQRILASSMTVSGGAMLASCGGSSTDASTTGTQSDGASGADGVGAGRADAPSPQEDAHAEGETTNDAQVADASADASILDAAATPDSGSGRDATSGDAHTAEAGSIDASVDGLDDATGVIVDAASGDGDAAFVVTSCGMTVPAGPSLSTGCYPECFPLDAGALTAIDAGDGGLFGAQCAALCGSVGNWLSCKPVADGGVSLIQCQPNCTGRRPSGLLASGREHDTGLGAHFAEMTRLEAASVDAFRHLRRELIAHGAPRRLVRAAERAARDEVRHARMTRALATRYGGEVIAPRVEPRPVRNLEAVAIENAVEGCVREAFGALIACFQAAAARDPVIRAAMARIARDETRHAALAFEVDAWLRGKLGGSARARVEAARDRALGELASNAVEAPAALRSTIGLPTRQQSRFLLDELTRIAA